jgi:GNAT superfamily N-acetyltransferase
MERFSNTNVTKPLREKIDPDRIDFRRLSQKCPREAFCCGNEHINDFFRRTALSDHTSLDCRVVTAHLDEDEQAVAFYAMRIGFEPESELIHDQGFFSKLASKVQSRLVITLQLSWVAVHNDWRRRGIGTLLMGHALDNFYNFADSAGVIALTLKPIDSNARTFYTGLGFVEYGGASCKIIGRADYIYNITIQ